MFGKIEILGKKFNTKTEAYFYACLVGAKIDFQQKEKIVVINSFLYRGKYEKAEHIVVDYIIYKKDKEGNRKPILIVFFKNVNKFKMKALKKYLLVNDMEIPIILKPTKKSIDILIEDIKKVYKKSSK